MGLFVQVEKKGRKMTTRCEVIAVAVLFVGKVWMSDAYGVDGQKDVSSDSKGGESSSSVGPHKMFVTDMLSRPLKNRVEEYNKKAQLLGHGKGVSSEEQSLESFVEEIVRQKDLDGLVGLEESLESMDAKTALWVSVARDGGEKEHELLKIWATKHPDAIELMSYSPGGQDQLLRALEDTTLRCDRRAMAARILGRIGDADALLRLRKLETDKTPLKEASMKIPRVLGDVVAQAMGVLQKRLKEKTGSDNGNAPKAPIRTGVE
jgi:hypothetical protein